MKRFGIGLILSVVICHLAHATAPEVSVCARTPQVRDALVKAINKPCEAIEVEDLHILESLTIQDKTLTKLVPGDFYNLLKLKFLKVSGSQLKHLRKGVFAGAEFIFSLDLHNNKISKIDNEVFLYLDLEHLNLSQNKLVTLGPKQIASPSLRSLSLSGNKIEAIDKGLLQVVPKLVRLNLDGNKISIFDRDSLLGFEKLETLTLDGCPLKEFDPKVLLHMQDLRFFSIGSEEYDPFNPEIVSVISQIFKNGPGAFGYGIGKFKFTNEDLIKINSISGLTVVSLKAESMPSLKGLNLGLLKSIVALGIEADDLEFIPAGAFLEMPNLNLIFFDRNPPLSKTTRAAFQGVPIVTGLPPSFGIDHSQEGEW